MIKMYKAFTPEIFVNALIYLQDQDIFLDEENFKTKLLKLILFLKENKENLDNLISAEYHLNPIENGEKLLELFQDLIKLGAPNFLEINQEKYAEAIKKVTERGSLIREIDNYILEILVEASNNNYLKYLEKLNQLGNHLEKIKEIFSYNYLKYSLRNNIIIDLNNKMLYLFDASYSLFCITENKKNPQEVIGNAIKILFNSFIKNQKRIKIDRKSEDYIAIKKKLMSNSYLLLDDKYKNNNSSPSTLDYFRFFMEKIHNKIEKDKLKKDDFLNETKILSFHLKVLFIGDGLSAFNIKSELEGNKFSRIIPGKIYNFELMTHAIEYSNICSSRMLNDFYFAFFIIDFSFKSSNLWANEKCIDQVLLECNRCFPENSKIIFLGVNISNEDQERFHKIKKYCEERCCTLIAKNEEFLQESLKSIGTHYFDLWANQQGKFLQNAKFYLK